MVEYSAGMWARHWAASTAKKTVGSWALRTAAHWADHWEQQSAVTMVDGLAEHLVKSMVEMMGLTTVVKTVSHSVAQKDKPTVAKKAGH